MVIPSCSSVNHFLEEKAVFLGLILHELPKKIVIYVIDEQFRISYPNV